MRITGTEMRAAAAAARRNANNATTDDEFKGSWLCLPQPGLTRRWDVVAEGEGSMIAASVHRASAEHIANWDPRAVHAVADLIDEFAARYEAAGPTPSGDLYDPACGGRIHADPADPATCRCFDAVTALVKAMRRGSA